MYTHVQSIRQQTHSTIGTTASHNVGNSMTLSPLDVNVQTSSTGSIDEIGMVIFGPT